MRSFQFIRQRVARASRKIKAAIECATNRAARDRLVSLVYLIYLVCLVEPDRPDEPDQPSPVSLISQVSLGYHGSNCEKLFAAECSKRPDFSPAQPWLLFHPPALSLPRQTLRPGTRLVPIKAANSRLPLVSRFTPHVSRFLLEESALLEKIFVYDWGRFGRKLSPFLQQSFDIFPDKVRFKIDLIAGLLEPQGRNLRRVRNYRD